jgi:hypothetical protein
MNRIVCVHGPWQLLLAASALRQATPAGQGGSGDHLVVFALHDGPLPSPLREVIDRIAPAVWPWERITMLEDFHGPTPASASTRWGQAIASLRERLGPGEAREVWLDCLWGGFEKVAAEAYPGSRIVLYEDGLQTYLPLEDNFLSARRWVRSPRKSLHSLKLRIREMLRRDDLSIAHVLHRHATRVAASYLWISQSLPPPDYQRRLPWVQLETRFLKETIAAAAPLAAELVPDATSGPGRVIVLGQCFSNYDDLPREVELAGYVELVRRMQDAGHGVIWKEHPRSRKPFFSELADAVGDVCPMPDIGPWPIELFAERLGLAGCAAVISTSLFSFPLLFGLPSYSVAQRYRQFLKFPNDLIGNLVASHVQQV